MKLHSKTWNRTLRNCWWFFIYMTYDLITLYFVSDFTVIDGIGRIVFGPSGPPILN